MSRGHSPNIKPEVRLAVLQVKTDHFDWSAANIRNHLLHKYASYKLTPEQVPQKRAIQKIIAEKYPDIEKFIHRPDQQPWHLGSPINNVLSVEVLPILLHLQQQKRQTNQRFSVMEARWAARLIPILKSFGYEDDGLLDSLEIWVNKYVSREKLIELSNVKNPSKLVKLGKKLFYPEGVSDTSDLDQDLFDTQGDYKQSRFWEIESIFPLLKPLLKTHNAGYQTGVIYAELTRINPLKEASKEEEK
jgi:hypothetical protein